MISATLRAMPEFLTPPFIIAILLALSVHEWAHGVVANYLGDPTARYEGRLTLNPLAHLDPVGTIMFLIVGFGWGKPVPVDPRHFKHYKRDMALVSLAGPFSNLILAFIAFGFLAAFFPETLQYSPDALVESATRGGLGRFLDQFLQAMLYLNLGLMAFNLLPIAPLDGSKILIPFIPHRFDDQYEQLMRNGPWILLALLVAERVMNVPILMAWISLVMSPILFVMGRLLGAV